MAKRKPKKESAKGKAAKKAPRKTTRKKPAARSPQRAAGSSRKVAAPKIRVGIITHTELASADPPATRAWCEAVLGWKFGLTVPTPAGPYHMWRSANDTGGGIRANNPPEVPGSIPYCEVADIRATYSKALAAGATGMVPPMQLPEGMGWVAIVAAPGGVAIGFWGMR